MMVLALPMYLPVVVRVRNAEREYERFSTPSNPPSPFKLGSIGLANHINRGWMVS